MVVGMSAGSRVLKDYFKLFKIKTTTTLHNSRFFDQVYLHDLYILQNLGTSCGHVHVSKIIIGSSAKTINPEIFAV